MRWLAAAVVGIFSALSTGCGTPSFLVTPVSHSTKLVEEDVKRGSSGKIAIIEVEGMLSNASTGGFFQPTENPVSLFAQQLDKAARDKNVKAVVLRVNSPGGTVTASDTMYSMVQKFRQETKKPVIASTQEVAASGAYYVALASDKIVSAPTSVVGSIGVIFNAIEFEGTMAKLGITAQSIKSGSLKDMGSPLKALEPQEKQVMQEMVDEYFVRFVEVVHERRPAVKETALASVSDYRKEGYAGVFSGRVYSGARAAQLGLVDQTGDLDAAIDLAKQLSKSPKAAVVMYRRPYGYGGSIYAAGSTPAPRANVLQLQVPGLRELPTGFYYLWEPGR